MVTVVSDPDNDAAFTLRRGTATRSVGRGVGMTVFSGVGSTLRLIALLRLTFQSLNDTPPYAGNARRHVRIDGAEKRLEYVSPPYRMAFFAGQGHEADEVLGRHVFAEAVRLPAGLVASRATYGAAPTGAVTHTLNRISGGTTTAVGSVAFDAGGADTVGAIAWPADVDFAAGDVLELRAPGGTDATARDLAVTLIGWTL
jgi:hypothetical protein